MSAVPVTPPKIGANERLGATLALSLIVHGLLVLGVGFALDDAAPVMPTLDVILSQTSTPLTPKQADFLAQANPDADSSGLEERYGEAAFGRAVNVRNFDGSAKVTEMDALIAYLQVLGTMVDFSTFEPDPNR